MKLFLATMLLCGSVYAGSYNYYSYDNTGSKYDYKSGNHYRWNIDSDGDTEVRGRNFYTGSNWKTTIESNGDMRGTDSNGNRWKYNADTDVYYNYGTGERRTKYERR